jgi:hypothetical protein
MTKLLEEAIAKLKTLSEDQQDRVAELLLCLAESEADFALIGDGAAVMAHPSPNVRRWLAENKDAIDAYNKRVADGAILSDLDRAF